MKPLTPHELYQLEQLRGPFAHALTPPQARRLLKAVRRSGHVLDPTYKERRTKNETTPVAYRRKRGLPDLIILNTGAQPQVA